MTPEEQYPSTSDCGLGTENEDLVIVCLKNALARYTARPSRGEYIDCSGEVCAIGAIGAVWAVGDGDEIGAIVRKAVSIKGYQGKFLAEHVERHLREEAKAAIRLLNAAALSRHPEAAEGAVRRNWTGPLEWVNQSWIPEVDVPRWDLRCGQLSNSAIHAEVRECYRYAMRLRLAELAAA